MSLYVDSCTVSGIDVTEALLRTVVCILRLGNYLLLTILACVVQHFGVKTE